MTHLTNCYWNKGGKGTRQRNLLWIASFQTFWVAKKWKLGKNRFPEQASKIPETVGQCRRKNANLRSIFSGLKECINGEHHESLSNFWELLKVSDAIKNARYLKTVSTNTSFMNVSNSGFRNTFILEGFWNFDAEKHCSCIFSSHELPQRKYPAWKICGRYDVTEAKIVNLL